jgi:hypothetical protein
VLISHRHRFIYTKTRKTAGTSVESYFEPYCMPEGQWAEEHHREQYVSPQGIIGARKKKAGATWWSHMDAAQIRKQLDEAQWSAYLKFCVIRNPFDKCVSQFFFLRDRGKNPVEQASSRADFERWLEETGPRLDRDNYVIDGRICMDVFVRYETLHADLERVCARLGVPWTPERLPRFKSGLRPAWGTTTALYTPRAKELVSRIFAFELSEFGYSFPEV